MTKNEDGTEARGTANRCPLCNREGVELVPFYMGTGRMMVCFSCRERLIKQLGKR